MDRRQRSADELRAASDHLHYEAMMFTTTASALASGAFAQSPVNNALLESFTIHARVPLDFLFPSKPQADDVIAEDFVAPETWQATRPLKSELIAGIHQEFGKEVAHLTYSRQLVTPETKQWPFIQIAAEVTSVLNLFLSLVPHHVLGGRWLADLQSPASTSPKA